MRRPPARHNTWGLSPRWQACRRPAWYLPGGQWGVGGYSRDWSQAGAGRGLSRAWLEKGHGNPRCSRSPPDRPFVCFVVGSFFKVTPEGCRLPGWRRPGGKRLAGGGVEWGGECAGCCRPCHLTTGVPAGAPYLRSCRGHKSLKDLVSRLLGKFF